VHALGAWICAAGDSASLSDPANAEQPRKGPR
jgi:hypothetical protein